MRLAEPESFSTDAVLTVSQAVRREVAAVGDGDRAARWPVPASSKPWCAAKSPL